MIIPLFLFDDRSLAQQRVALNLSEEFKSIRRCRGDRGGERRRLRAPIRCGQRRACMPVKLMMTLTRQKTILKVSLPRCSALSSLSLGRQRRRNPCEASSRGVGELKGFNYAERETRAMWMATRSRPVIGELYMALFQHHGALSPVIEAHIVIDINDQA